MNGSFWTTTEIARLMSIYEYATDEQLAEVFANHTVLSARRKACSLGLKKKKTTRRSRYPVIIELWNLRIRLGYTRKYVADLIGCHEMMLSRYERGESTPRLQGLVNWCEALGVKLLISSRD